MHRASLAPSLVLIGLLAACGEERQLPTQPSPQPNIAPPSPPAPAPPTQAVVSGCRVDGPDLIPPGESAQYTATAVYSDGSKRDLTNEAQWSVTDESILSVTGAGKAGGRAMGDAEVRATFANSCSVGRAVLVLPAGRFLLWAGVTEDQVTAPILGVRVEVVSGPAAGLTATPNWEGGAKLLGVSQDAELRFSKDGYEPVVQTVHLERQRQSVRVQMFPSKGRLDLPGKYELTIASGACSAGDGLPEAVKTRTYTARMWNAGLKIHVELSGANFAVESCPACSEPRGNRFMGQTQALDARFTLIEYGPPAAGAGPWDLDQGIYPSVAERLSDGRLLSISGQAIVTPTPQGFSGTLDGSIAIFDSLPLLWSPGRVLASCRSSDHRFTLVR